jgi:drug/metabolite transporter (DMT)-like permease
MSWTFLKERIGLRTWAAVVCAVVGVTLVSLSKQEHITPESIGLELNLTPKNSILGTFLLLGAVFCEAAYAVIGKKLVGELSPKRITALINLWGFLLVTPMGLWAAWQFDFASVSAPSWLLLVFYSLAASVWTVWLWMTGLKTIPAAKAGVFTVFLPVSAAAVGVVFLGESLGPLQALAFGVALLGVVLATLPTKR